MTEIDLALPSQIVTKSSLAHHKKCPAVSRSFYLARKALSDVSELPVLDTTILAGVRQDGPLNIRGAIVV